MDAFPSVVGGGQGPMVLCKRDKGMDFILFHKIIGYIFRVERDYLL